MTKENEVPYPSEAEINNQISQIIERGLYKKPSITSEFKQLVHPSNWRYFMPNKNEWLFTFIILAMIFSYLFVATRQGIQFETSILSFIFIFSPLLFISQTLFSLIDKQNTNVYLLEMTTKYTVFQFITIRMFVFSSISIVTHTSIAFCFANSFHMSSTRLWLLSLSSLFVFAVGLLILFYYKNSIQAAAYYSISWLATSIVCIFTMKEWVLSLMVALPLYIYSALIILLIVCFIKLCLMNFAKHKGGFIHA